MTPRVLITGGKGFLGRHLCARLGGENVYAPSRRAYDLLDRDSTFSLFRDTKPEIVFHLAAEVGGIGANRDNPGRYWYANTLMGLNVLEASRVYGAQKLIMVGTVCAYPKFTDIPFSEDDLWNGYPEETNAPYGVAKRSLLVGAQAYREQYGLNTIYLLPANLYGPGDNFDLHTSHVIPAIIRKMVDAVTCNADSVALWGNGIPTREFLYVKDCADGLLLAAERYNKSSPVNLGNGEEISIRDLAFVIADMVGFKGIVHFDRVNPGGQPRRALSTDKAKEEFGFSAKTSLIDGLEETIRWYRNSDNRR